MTDSLVNYENNGGIVRLTLNRPDKLNAINDQMIRDIAAAFERLDQDDTAHVAILHGAGRAFCSGADVAAAQQRTDAGSGMWSSTLRPRDAYYKSINWKPVIAAAHGYALGAGLGIALRCDMLVVTSSLKMQVTEVPRGLPAGGLWALLRFRGMGALADDIIFTGRFFSGEEAFKSGIANAATANDDYLAVAQDYAERIQKLPANAIRSAVRTRRWYMEQAERDAGFISEARPVLAVARQPGDGASYTKADQLVDGGGRKT
jgi:enoyl-CoA hydratase/carnithine racemase